MTSLRQVTNGRRTVSPPFCFVFVCQAGELEIKSTLLAASLRRHFGRRVDLVAAIPHPEARWGTISETTRTFFQEVGVRLIPIVNRVNQNYGIANKIGCLSVTTEASKTVFLDSDILCFGPAPDDAFGAPVNAKPADLPTWHRDERPWREVYSRFGLPLPTRRVIATVSGDTMLPYFNSGVIAIDSNTNFANVWEECCIQIDTAGLVEDKGWYLDQVALPVAIARCGLTFACLSEAYNFPAHLKTVPTIPPIFCHYHWPSIIRREPLLNRYVNELVRAHSILRKLIENGESGWRQVIAPRPVPPPTDGRFALWPRRKRSRLSAHETTGNFPELVITGISRSGTSLLCRLLHDLPDIVIINEPAAIFSPLTRCENPFWLSTFYRDLRRDILDGAEIENKVINGRVVEDTCEIDQRVPYRPTVSRPDFILGTKNTLAYLARLAIIKRAMPHAVIVACIRHPLDTIASWKGSFPHLREVRFRDFPVSYTENLFLTGLERGRLQEIQNTDNPATRRALLWSHLAETIVRHQNSLLVVKYEDLMATPEATIQRILAALPEFDCAPPKIPAMQPRSRRELLDSADYDAVADLCGTHAAHFGYRI